MREIKFQAWDKKSKKIRQVDSIAFHNKNSVFDYDDLPKIVGIRSYDIIEQKEIILYKKIKDIILRQYTGLNDKNGKEIYEGDIVIIWGFVFEVIYTSGSFCIVSKDYIDWEVFENKIKEYTGCNNRPYFTFCDNVIPLYELYWNYNEEESILHCVQVIGNIYENPKLMEGVKTE